MGDVTLPSENKQTKNLISNTPNCFASQSTIGGVGVGEGIIKSMLL